jgi:hypothetical protein
VIAAAALLLYCASTAASNVARNIVKLTEDGYPEDVTALDRLTSEDRGRFRLWQIAQHMSRACGCVGELRP